MTSTSHHRTGLLVVNLGTPDAPTTPAVRRYLAEFLSDPRVIDIHPVVRFLLLHAIILRTRPKKSAAAYQQVWTEAGSPLLVHGQALTAGLAEALGEDWVVTFAMRYGRPTLADALQTLDQAGVRQIVVFPLYPQYASSSTGSTLARVMALVQDQDAVPNLAFVPEFYDDPGFVASVASVARPILDDFRPDHVLLSYHGLPERHVRATDPTKAHCLADGGGCCDAMVPANARCYRAQCFATSRALITALGLDDDAVSVSFQSRLGRTPWIQPFTDEAIPALAARGVKRLAVLCPSFVADCLETLEEIGIRAEELFLQAGGEALVQVPCVNASPRWIEATAALARRAACPPEGGGPVVDEGATG